jgi:phenylpropionate dioxygenase-like ring-hydroxylating dioxygenase large terminal subunit
MPKAPFVALHDLLDSGRFDQHRAEQSWTLPASWYFDPAIYELEHEKIFYKTWWYVCHVSDVVKPGDYHVGSIADQSIFVIRDKSGELKAFYNVCSHRAHPLLEGSGNTNLVVCPYHQWCYQPDGRFRGARGRETLKDWIPDNADLKPVRLELYGSFVFVNLDPKAAPLSTQAPKLVRDMYECCPQLDKLVRVKRAERDVAANWKTIVDNNHECYHCTVNHKSLMEIVDYNNKATWFEDGITFSHKVEHKNLANSAYSINEDDLKQESLFGFIFPNTIPLFFPGSPGVVMFQILPTGPETAKVRHDFYFLSEALSEPERSFMAWMTNTLVSEDMAICERVQTGLHSRGYRQGKFVVDRDHVEFSEHHVHLFQKFVHEGLVG